MLLKNPSQIETALATPESFSNAFSETNRWGVSSKMCPTSVAVGSGDLYRPSRYRGPGALWPRKMRPSCSFVGLAVRSNSSFHFSFNFSFDFISNFSFKFIFTFNFNFSFSLSGLNLILLERNGTPSFNNFTRSLSLS